MIQAYGGYHRHLRGYHVRRIQPAAKPDLHDLEISSHISEVRHGERGQHLEESNPAVAAVPADRFHVGPYLLYLDGEILLGNRLQPDAHALAHGVKMGRREEARLVSGLRQYRGYQRADAPLPLRSGYVDARGGVVNVVQPLREQAYPLQVERGVTWKALGALEVGEAHRKLYSLLESQALARILLSHVLVSQSLRQVCPGRKTITID